MIMLTKMFRYHIFRFYYSALLAVFWTCLKLRQWQATEEDTLGTEELDTGVLSTILGSTGGTRDTTIEVYRVKTSIGEVRDSSDQRLRTRSN